MFSKNALSTIVEGCCSDIKPEITTQIGANGKAYYSRKLKTYSFAHFNYIYELFYVDKKKRVPESIAKLLTPRALAIWIMDDGGKNGSGLKISTESFTYEEVKLLRDALLLNFGLHFTIQKA